MRLRKSVLVMLTALLAFSALLAAAPRANAADEGVVYVSSAAELKAIAKNVNEGTNLYAGFTVKLTKDIDLNNEEWTPIGAYGHYEYPIYGSVYVANEFQGILDGQGHTISGLNITKADANTYSVGLIGWGGTVKNLIVVGNITLNSLQHFIATGGIIGRGNAENCISRVNVDVSTMSKTTTSGTTYYPALVGGVVGAGTAHRCVGESTVRGVSAIGTYVGSDGKTYTTGTTTYVGGIVGCVIKQLLHGPVIGTGGASTYCSYEGAGVYGNGYNSYVGGIIGAGLATDNSVTNPGSVTGKGANKLYLGVIAGRISDKLEVWNVYGSKYEVAVTKQNARNAIVGDSDFVMAGQGRKVSGSTSEWTALQGSGYYWPCTAATELQPVILQFEAPESGTITYGSEKSLTELGAKIKWMYPENRSFARVGAEDAIACSTPKYRYWSKTKANKNEDWSYFKSEPQRVVTTPGDARTQIESALGKMKISHIVDAYKKGYFTTAPSISVGVERTGESGYSSYIYSDSEYLWFNIKLNKHSDKKPTPVPIPVVTPPSAPTPTGWLSKADDSYTKEGNVYTISTAAQLASIAKDIAEKANNFAGKTIKLAGDIDLSGDKWVVSVPNKNPDFAGTFDGQGHTIKNMCCVDDSSGSGGLFYTLSNDAVIQNLHVEGIVSCDQGVGGIVYINNGTVKDSSFAGKLSSTNFNWSGAGGVTYNNQGTISNCTTNVEMTNSGNADNDAYGGIASANSGGTITGCTSNGTINVTTGTGSNPASISVGGVVGSNCTGGTVKNSESRVNITTGGTQFAAVGGIAGLNGESESDASAIVSCKSYGTLPAFDKDKTGVGGIVGINYKAATVKDSGWLKGTAASFAGKNNGAEPVNTTTFETTEDTPVNITGSDTEESAAAVESSVIPTTKGVMLVKPQLLNLTFISPAELSLDMTVSADMNGNLVVDKDSIIENMPSNIDTASFDIMPLPLYLSDISLQLVTGDEGSASLPNTGLVAIETTLNAYADQAPSKIVLMKVLKDNDIRAFKWAVSAAAVGDGEFFIASDAAGTPVDGNIKADTKYYVFIGVKDNGDYDLDPAEGSILDPTVLGVSGTSPSPTPGGGSSGGCSAGVAVLALLALPILVYRGKK